jgi:hypothetical protein
MKLFREGQPFNHYQNRITTNDQNSTQQKTTIYATENLNPDLGQTIIYESIHVHWSLYHQEALLYTLRLIRVLYKSAKGWYNLNTNRYPGLKITHAF